MADEDSSIFLDTLVRVQHHANKISGREDSEEINLKGNEWLAVSLGARVVLLLLEAGHDVDDIEEAIDVYTQSVQECLADS